MAVVADIWIVQISFYQLGVRLFDTSLGTHFQQRTWLLSYRFGRLRYQKGWIRVGAVVAASLNPTLRRLELRSMGTLLPWDSRQLPALLATSLLVYGRGICGLPPCRPCLKSTSSSLGIRCGVACCVGHSRPWSRFGIGMVVPPLCGQQSMGQKHHSRSSVPVAPTSASNCSNIAWDVAHPKRHFGFG